VNRLLEVTLLAALVAGLGCTPSEGARQAPGAGETAAGPASDTAHGDSVAHVIADSARITGSPDAALWIVEISDFQCPYCRMWHDSTFDSLVESYVRTGKARFAYLNLPLPDHANAMPAAEAAMCAGLQGKFWEMHDAIFKSQQEWSGLSNPWPVFTALATQRGIDAGAIRSCADEDVLVPLIQADAARAVEAGVQSTPTFLIGNVMLSGAYPFDAMRQVIDSLLAARAP
jgi:protein-disulfide isomerase